MNMRTETFSPSGYRSLIGSLVAMEYHFVSVNDFDVNSSERQVVLRHDVDYSPLKAAELAKHDHSMGVCSTFFFLLRGHWYNFLGHNTQDAVRKIYRMGFPIGLHYAPPPHIGENQRAHRQQLLHDFEIMRSEFPYISPVFSWHVPPPLALRAAKFRPPEGIVDMYSEPYFHKATYISDSSLRNSYEYLAQAVLSNKSYKLQLLLHAECWLAAREMSSQTDMIADILRSVIAEGEADLKEKPDYRNLLPSGIPSRVLDDVATLFVNTVRNAKKRSSRNSYPDRA